MNSLIICILIMCEFTYFVFIRLLVVQSQMYTMK